MFSHNSLSSFPAVEQISATIIIMSGLAHSSTLHPKCNELICLLINLLPPVSSARGQLRFGSSSVEGDVAPQMGSLYVPTV